MVKFRIHGNIGDRNNGNFLAIIRDFGVGLILAMWLLIINYEQSTPFIVDTVLTLS